MSDHTKPTTSLRNVTVIVRDLTCETDAIVALRLLKELHDWVTAAQTTAVGQAMAQGHTHRDIGEALGVSQQAISKRYGCAKHDDEQDSAETERKSASKLKALAHFTPHGDYVGYSLSIEVADLPSATEPPTERDSRQPSPDTSSAQTWVSDAETAVSEIAAPSAGQQLHL